MVQGQNHMDPGVMYWAETKAPLRTDSVWQALPVADEVAVELSARGLDRSRLEVEVCSALGDYASEAFADLVVMRLRMAIGMH